MSTEILTREVVEAAYNTTMDKLEELECLYNDPDTYKLIPIKCQIKNARLQMKEYWKDFMRFKNDRSAQVVIDFHVLISKF